MYANHFAKPSIHDGHGALPRPAPRWQPCKVTTRFAVLACLTITALACAGGASAATLWTVTTHGDDLSGTTCNLDHTCMTLRDAIFTAEDGDTIVFDQAMLPATIALTNSQALSIVGKSLTINGPGYNKLSINGGVASRIFEEPSASGNIDYVETISGVTITAGAAIGAAGSNATTPGAAGARGESPTGGCILVGTHYTVHLNFDRISSCFAIGGNGGTGAMGSPGSNGADGSGFGGTGQIGGTGNSGGAGGDGGTAYGGAIYVSGTLIVDSSTLDRNVALGGGGGNGAKGGAGGNGGDGMSASCQQPPGGGPCVPQGNGGDGGAGGIGGTGGAGGAAGSGYGGAIYTDPTGTVSLTNTTITDNSAGADFTILFGILPTPGVGGSGGNAGVGGSGGQGLADGSDGAVGYTGSVGSAGGPGGGSGGALAFANLNTGPGSTLKHTTVAFNQTTGGASGFVAAETDGAGISNGVLDTLDVWNSIIASNVANVPAYNTTNHSQVISNCHGDVTATNDNLEDSNGTDACGFTVQGDPNFAPPVNGVDAYPWGGNGLPVLMPLSPSPVINGAAVHAHGLQQVGGCAVHIDQRGAARPYQHTQPVGGGGFIILPDACDLGAVQNDIIFHNGFEN